MRKLRFDAVRVVIALLISVLIAWLFYEFGRSADSDNLWLAAGAGLGSALYLIVMLGLAETSRMVTSARVSSGLFFACALMVNVIFSLVNFSHPLFVIVNAAFVLVWFLIAYSVLRLTDQRKL